MRNGDGPVRDEERGTRELPAGRVDGLDGPRRAVEGVDGIPEQARPHPEDAQESLSGQDDGQRIRRVPRRARPRKGGGW